MTEIAGSQDAPVPLHESRAEEMPRPRGRAWSALPWVVSGAVLAATVVAMRVEGRRWWCACGEPWPWISDVWTSHCSQHLADPYSLTHLSHGLIFFGVLAIVASRLSMAWRLCAALTAAAAWEVLENSPLIINRYRAATMSLDYLGDSVVNALGDVLSCVLGFYVARRLGFVRSLVLFLVIEVFLLIVMRDNLTLNVLMLIYPVPGIKAWQSVGHV